MAALRSHLNLTGQAPPTRPAAGDELMMTENVAVLFTDIGGLDGVVVDPGG